MSTPSPSDGSDAPVIRDIAQISNKLSYWKEKEKQREAEAPSGAGAENRPRRFSAEGKKLNDLLAFWQNVSQPGSDRTRAATAAPPPKVPLVTPPAAVASPSKPVNNNLQLPSSHGPPKFRISPSGGLARPIGAAAASGPARGPASAQSTAVKAIPTPAVVKSTAAASPPSASSAPATVIAPVAAPQPALVPTPSAEPLTESKSPVAESADVAAHSEPEPSAPSAAEPSVAEAEHPSVPAAPEPVVVSPQPEPTVPEPQPESVAVASQPEPAVAEAQPEPAAPGPLPESVSAVTEATVESVPASESAETAAERAATPVLDLTEPPGDVILPAISRSTTDFTLASDGPSATVPDLTPPAISRSTTDFALAADESTQPAEADLSLPAISRSTTDLALATDSARAPAPAAAFMPPSLSRSSTDFFLTAAADTQPTAGASDADVVSPALSRSTTDFALAPLPEEDGLSDTSAADAQPISRFIPPSLSRSSTDFALVAADDLAPPPPALPSIPESADATFEAAFSPSNDASSEDLPAIARSTTDFALVAAASAPADGDVIQPAISRSITDFELVAASQPSLTTELSVADSQAIEPVARILSQQLELLPPIESVEDSIPTDPSAAQAEAAAVATEGASVPTISKTGSLRRLSDIFANANGALPAAGGASDPPDSGAPVTSVEDVNIDEARDRVSSVTSSRAPSSVSSDVFQLSSRTLSKPLGAPSSSSSHHHHSQVELLKQRYPAIRDKLHARSARRVAAVATLSQGVAGQLQRRVLTNAPVASASNGTIMMRSRPGQSVPMPADTTLSANKAASMLIGMVATARKDELRAAFADLEPPAPAASQGPSQPATPQLGPSPLRTRTARPSTAKTPQRTMTSLTSLSGLHQRRPSLSENDDEKSVSIADDKTELTAEERAKKEQESAAKRQKVVEEIVSSEVSYVESLERLIQGFIHPMKTSSSLNISAEKTTVIFGNVEILISFHRMFLAQMQLPNANLPELFLKYADFLKMYTQYLNGYNNALNVINSLREHTRFQQFLANKRNNDGMDLMSYLIMPVQRIPRYELLLREMKKHTPSSHPEHAALQEAFRKIRLIAKHINEEKRQVENMSKVLEVQNRISGEFQEALLQPYRRLVREGFVFQMTGTLFHSYEQRTVFLFNDMLIWTSQNGKYKGNVKLMTAEAKTFATKDKESRSEQYFGLELWNRTDVLKDNAVQFFCRTVAERDSWLTDIQDTIQLLQDIVQPTQRQRMEHRAENIRNRAHDKRHEIHEMIKKSLRNLRDESAMPAMRPLDLSQVSLDVESSVGVETDREDTYDGLTTPHTPNPLVDHTIISPDPVDPDFSPDIFDAMTRQPRERANSL